MFAVTSHSRPQLDFADMRSFLEHGWGELGIRVADCWRDFNDCYFDGRLKPLPIVLVATSPHGHWLGLTHPPASCQGFVLVRTRQSLVIASHWRPSAPSRRDCFCPCQLHRWRHNLRGGIDKSDTALRYILARPHAG